MSQLIFCLQPGVKWLWFVCHEPCSKTDLLVLYFRWGEGSPTSVLGSQPIIWLLSLSPSDVRRPEVTKYEHLVSPAWPTFLPNGHLFDSLILSIQIRGVIIVLPLRLRGLSRDINIISKSKHKKFIFSDSLSVLLLLRNKKFQNPLIIKLLSRLDFMSNRKKIIICQTPSHIGVRGNKRADLAAQSALDLMPDKSRIPYTDLN